MRISSAWCPRVPVQRWLLSRDWMDFKTVRVMARSTGGSAYPRWIGVGVPIVKTETLNSVAYLYQDKASAEKGGPAGGSGFFVHVPSKEPGFIHEYLVSNYHVSIAEGNSIARVNKKGGGVVILEFDPSDWVCLPNGGDVAAVRVELNDDEQDIDSFPEYALLRQSWDESFSVGSDVFMVGRFIDHDGGLTNTPSARFGNISVGPVPLTSRAPNSDKDMRHFCLDMHSRTGYSGSPVIVYRTMGSEIAFSELPAPDIPIHGPQAAVLGIHCGQFKEVMEAESKSGPLDLKGPSGMTFVLPAWEIRKLLDIEKFAKERERLDFELWKKGGNRPCPE